MPASAREAFAAMTEPTRVTKISYGNDTWTEKASNLIRDVSKPGAKFFFVFNAHRPNSISLASLPVVSQHSVPTKWRMSKSRNGGAPEFFANGPKSCSCPAKAGKSSRKPSNAPSTTDRHPLSQTARA